MCADDPIRSFGKRLRLLRRRAQLTQAKLAENADISCVYVNKLERGLAAPSIHVLHRLAQCLGTDVASLLTPDGADPSAQVDGAQPSPYLALYLAGHTERLRQLIFGAMETPIPLHTVPKK